mgnify:CR=1 FL=1
MKIYFIYSLLLLSIWMTTTGCAPTFSELQSARLVGKNQLEVTPSYSSVSYHETGDNEKIQNHYGFQAALGLMDKMDFRLRYEYVTVPQDEINVHLVGLGPKFSFIEDRFAGYFPVGFGFGEDIGQIAETWQIHPTLLGTIPFSNNVEFNPSTKALIPFQKDQNVLFALNFGLGLSSDLTKWAIRPEYGFLFDPSQQGNFQHFSIAVTITSK